ncbi:hypothetical protein [Haliangium sp.]|uniref:hypothetical protein n=1 Tax=Haliangium sp. TaxID=2663208 RepID=UPI003D0AA7E7
MKAAEKRRIARAIKAAVPGLYEKGGVLAATPRGRILRGIVLEGSAADPHGVYLWKFVQPLYVPSTEVVLLLGDRLGGGCKTWRVDEAEAAVAAIREEGVPFFGPIDSPEKLASWEYLDGKRNVHIREVKAYSLIAVGRFVEGIQALRQLADSLREDDGEEMLPWDIEMRERAERLAALAETNPPAAHELLAEWEAETVSALRLQDVP